MKTRSQQSLTELNEAKAQLQEQYELLQIAGKTSRFGAWAVELEDGRSIWSDAVAEIHELPKGSSPPAAEGINYYVPEHRQRITEVFKACAENGTPYDEELQIITHHGRRVWVRTCGRAVKNKEGKVTRVHGSFQDIDEKKKNEEELQQRIEYERMSAQLSRDLSHLDIDEIYTAIQGSLSQLREFTASDRAYIFQFRDDFLTADNTFECCAEGIEPQIEQLQGISFEDELPWLAQKYIEGRSVYIPNVGALPEEAALTRKHLESQGIKSLIVEPIKTANNMIGFVGFDAVRDYREWGSDQKALLQYYGQIVGNVLEWKKSQEALKANEEHFRLIFENANDGVCIVSLGGEFTQVNQRMCDILGYSKAELESMTVVEVTHLEDGELSSKLFESITTGKSKNHVFEKRYIRKDGAILWGQVSTTLLRDKGGEPLHFISHLMDISERKKMEEIKEDVDRMMRHDLKTPLGPIIGLPQLLRMEQNLSQEQISMLKVIETAGQELLSLIDSSRDLFKMEAGDFSYDPKSVDVVDIVAKLVEQKKAAASAMSLSFKVSLDGALVEKGDELMLQSEPELLYRMLANLLTNAIEASPENNVVEVCLKREESKEVVIRNKGAVPKDIREHFFEKYVTSGKKNGTGLGTYSAKLIANEMGYELHMQTSDEEDMTEVRIVIP